MRIEEGEASAGLEILGDQVQDGGRFARAGLADEMQVAAAIGLRQPKGRALRGGAYEAGMVAVHGQGAASKSGRRSRWHRAKCVVSCAFGDTRGIPGSLRSSRPSSSHTSGPTGIVHTFSNPNCVPYVGFGRALAFFVYRLCFLWHLGSYGAFRTGVRLASTSVLDPK